MLTLSIVWLVLATAVTVIATSRRRMTASNPETRAETGSSLAVLAIAYGIILLIGFVYVGWHQSAGLIR